MASCGVGRARRRVAVVDAGEPRNAPAVHMHGSLSRDAMLPAASRCWLPCTAPLAAVFTPMNEFDWSRELDPSAWVWQVSLGLGEPLDSQGTHVFLDFETGEVLWVMNTRG